MILKLIKQYSTDVDYKSAKLTYHLFVLWKDKKLFLMGRDLCFDVWPN